MFLRWPGPTACLVLVPLAAGQEIQDRSADRNLPRYRVVHLPESTPAPVIDGVVDDPAWALAAPMGGFVQVEPRPGLPASQRTELKLVRTRDALYVAYLAYDDTPAGIRGSQRARDANLDPDDRIEILLATLGDGRNAFWFQIGPAGGQGDALIGLSGGSFQKDWDGIWTARSRRTAEGWFAEFEIPFATLDFDPDLDTWGFNARRFVRRAEEESRWASPSPDSRFFAPEEFGLLEGMGGIERGLGLDIRPFGKASWEDLDGDISRDLDGGLDLFWRLTPNAKVALSLNTDFAEAEVDDRQLNLTRFPLFFPEKRDFFLEDSSAFLFGSGASNDVLPFFSRRIGLDADREPVPILAAGKFVYRNEDWSVGLLDAQVDSAGDVDTQNLAVLRVQRRLGAQSDIGLVGTNGDPAVDRGAQTIGVDANLRTRELFGDQRARLSVSWIASRVEEAGPESETESGSAQRVELDYPNDRFDAGLSYSRVEADFDPRLGFVRRPGTETWSGDFYFQPRLDGAIRQLRTGFTPTRIESIDGGVESESLRLVPLEVSWVRGDTLTPSVSFEREVLLEPFELPGEIPIAEGDYSFARYGLELETSDRRPLALGLSFEGGGFYDGQRRDYGVDLTWFQSAAFNWVLSYEQNQLHLPSGNDDLHVLSNQFVIVPDQDLSLRLLVQYDSLSDDLGLDGRVRWIRSPGNELFLVVSQSYLADAGSFRPTRTDAIVKIGWTLRL